MQFNPLAVNHDVTGIMSRLYCWDNFLWDLPLLLQDEGHVTKHLSQQAFQSMINSIILMSEEHMSQQHVPAETLESDQHFLEQPFVNQQLPTSDSSKFHSCKSHKRKSHSSQSESSKSASRIFKLKLIAAYLKTIMANMGHSEYM